MEIITAKINVSKIDKARLFKGKSGTYLDITLIPTKPSNYGDDRDENTHVIVQSVTKEERLAGNKGNILGNAKCVSTRSAPTPAAAATPAEPPADEEIPF